LIIYLNFHQFASKTLTFNQNGIYAFLQLRHGVIEEMVIILKII